MNRLPRLLVVPFVIGAGWTASASLAAQRAPEVVVSATRFADRTDALAVNATVITADDIARSTATTLPDLLGARAGVQSRDLYGNNAALATVDLRGFGTTGTENTLILLDGRPLNDIDQSGVQWSSIPLHAIERIEILRGSGAVQYGAGASAGVINIITRHPGQGGNRASIAARAGSFDSTDLNLSANLQTSTVGLNFVARNYESDGYRVNNRQRLSNFALTGTWSGSGADATLRVSTDRQGLRLPGARLVDPSVPIDLLATDRRGAQTPDDFAQRNGNHVSLDLAWQGALGEFALGIGYRDKTQRSLFDFPQFFFSDYRQVDLDVLTVQPRYRWRGAAFGAEHSLVLGVDIARWDYRLLRSDVPANIGRAFTTVGAKQDNNSIYLHDTLTLTPRTTLSAGLRREQQRISAIDRLDAGAPGGAFETEAPAVSETNTMHAYEAGVRHQWSEAVALIMRGSRSFRFANIDEIYEFSALGNRQFQLLRPQRARTYEAGVQLGRQAAHLRATAFRMDVKDEIHLDIYTFGTGNRNMPPSRRTGLELELGRSFGGVVDLFAAYTYTRARFLSGDLNGLALTGRVVPLVPRHKLNLALDWRMAEHTRLRVEGRYASEQRMENDEGNNYAQQIPGYGVVDAKLSHRAGAWSASMGVANLFDRKYYNYAVHSINPATPDRFNAYPLPERTLWFALSYNGW